MPSRTRFRMLYIGHASRFWCYRWPQRLCSGCCKAKLSRAPYCIPNEFVCGELGRFLGLPMAFFSWLVRSRFNAALVRLW